MFTVAKAQPNLAFYPLEDQFNSFDYNPAFLTSREKFTFSIFPLGGISTIYNNQEVITDLATKFLTGVVYDQDFKKIFNKAVDKPFFHQTGEISLLSFTYRSPVGFFNFRIKDSQHFLASIEGETTKYIFKSQIPIDILNQIQHLPAQAAHYREYSLGYSHKSRSKRFTAGIRAKLYFGKFSAYSDIEGSIQAVPNTINDFVLKTSGIINLSFPQNGATFSARNLIITKINDYIWNRGNPGMGVDLGLRYQLKPNLTFSMSVIDLGRIN